MKNQGILYIATGKKHIAEAIQSATRVKQLMPQFPITLISDEKIAEPIFDQILHLEKPGYTIADKILPLVQTPYEKTLFLDTDTYMVDSCEELFPILDHFELGAAHDAWRREYSFEQLPACFPTLNTGVILYRNNETVRSFIRKWADLHLNDFAKKTFNDQPAFRATIYQSGVKLFVLPMEYNLRTYYPCSIGGHSTVKIIHDRNPHIPMIAKAMNKSERPRIFGRIFLHLALCYYFTKASNVMHRWFGWKK